MQQDGLLLTFLLERRGFKSSAYVCPGHAALRSSLRVVAEEFEVAAEIEDVEVGFVQAGAKEVAARVLVVVGTNQA